MLSRDNPWRRSRIDMTFAISEAIAEAVVAPHGALGNNLCETGCGDHPAARTCGGDDVPGAVCPHRRASPYKTRPDLPLSHANTAEKPRNRVLGHRRRSARPSARREPGRGSPYHHRAPVRRGSIARSECILTYIHDILYMAVSLMVRQLVSSFFVSSRREEARFARLSPPLFDVFWV